MKYLNNNNVQYLISVASDNRSNVYLEDEKSRVINSDKTIMILNSQKNEDSVLTAQCKLNRTKLKLVNVSPGEIIARLKSLQAIQFDYMILNFGKDLIFVNDLNEKFFSRVDLTGLLLAGNYDSELPDEVNPTDNNYLTSLGRNKFASSDCIIMNKETSNNLLKFLEDDRTEIDPTKKILLFKNYGVFFLIKDDYAAHVDTQNNFITNLKAHDFISENSDSRVILSSRDYDVRRLF